MDLNNANVKSFNIGINDINNVQTEDEVNQGSILGYVSSTNNLESLNNEHTVFQFDGNTIENAYVILQNLGLSHAADILKKSTESQGEGSNIDFLALASGALLCEPLTDDIENRVDWIELNKISEVEDENSKDILRIIENHAEKLKRSFTNAFQVQPLSFKLPVVTSDSCIPSRFINVKASCGCTGICLEIENPDNEYPNEPILLEHYNGELRIAVWANSLEDDPTHIVNLN